MDSSEAASEQWLRIARYRRAKRLKHWRNMREHLRFDTVCEALL